MYSVPWVPETVLARYQVCPKISATREKEYSGTRCLKNETINNH